MTNEESACFPCAAEARSQSIAVLAIRELGRGVKGLSVGFENCVETSRQP